MSPLSAPATENVKRKRPWLRFSLRTLLILFAIVAVGLAAVTSRMRSAKSQAKIVAAVESMGGGLGGGPVHHSFEEGNVVAFDPGCSGWPKLANEFVPYTHKASPVPGILLDLLGVDFFHAVRAVELYEPVYFSPELGEALRDSDRREFDRIISLVSQLDGVDTISVQCSWKCNLEPLSQLSGLKRVALNMDVEKNDLAFLKGSEVTSLLLGGAVDDESLEIISELPALERLQMRVGPRDTGSTFTHNGVAKLVELECLKELRLNSDIVDDDIGDSLSKMGNLERLGLRLPATEQSIAQHIAPMSVRDLRLISMVIDSELFRVIGKMERIEILCLAESRGYQELSDIDFTALMNSRSLREVHLGDIACSYEQYRSLVTKFGETSFSARLSRKFQSVESVEFYAGKLKDPGFVWKGWIANEGRIPVLHAARALACIGDEAVPLLLDALEDETIDKVSIFDALQHIGLPVGDFQEDLLDRRDTTRIRRWWERNRVTSRDVRSQYREQIGLPPLD
jgi:hypothetical protein